MATKLVSINIEGSKHLDSVGRFLDSERADIVCLMEVSRDDVLQIAGDNYPFVVFAPNDVIGNIAGQKGTTPTGVAILSKTIMIDVEKEYFGEQPRKVIVDPGSGSQAPVLLSARIGSLLVGAVHFTWTKKGQVSDDQKKHVGKLLEYLQTKGELLMCGDFNIPRGKEMYMQIAAKYKDNIPAIVETTIDPDLHYANQGERGSLKTVVDYIWSTPGIKVEEVEVKEGISDHCGLVCQIR